MNKTKESEEKGEDRNWGGQFKTEGGTDRELETDGHRQTSR